MPLLWAILYEMLILALGYATLSLLYRGSRRGLGETFGLSQALGVGMMGTPLFYASLAGLKPSRALLICIASVTAIAFVILWRRGGLTGVIPSPHEEGMGRGDSQADMGPRIETKTTDEATDPSPRPSPLPKWRGGVIASAIIHHPSSIFAFLAFLLLLYLFIAVTLHALAFPLYEWDAFAIWGLKAKVVTYDSLRSNPAYFHDASLSYSHPDYPLLLPFLTSGVYAAMGHVDDRLGKIVLPPLFAAYGAITFMALRWKLPRNQSILLTAILLAVPLCTRWAGSGYADVPLTLFYGASIFFLVKWLDESSGKSSPSPLTPLPSDGRGEPGRGTIIHHPSSIIPPDLLLACLFSVFAALTKSEGLGLAIINIIVLFIFSICRSRRKEALINFASIRVYSRFAVKPAICFAAGLVALLLPWLIWSRGLPHTHETSASKLVAGLSNLGLVLRGFAVQFVEFDNWGGIWLLLVLAAAISWKGFRLVHIQALWLLLAAHLALYLAVYLMTSFGVRELLTYSLDRVLLHTTPAVIFLIGYHWAAVAVSKAK